MNELVELCVVCVEFYIIGYIAGWYEFYIQTKNLNWVSFWIEGRCGELFSFDSYKNRIRANLGNTATQCPYTKGTAKKKKATNVD